MVFTEEEAFKKTQIMAVCEMCDCKIPDAKSCYCNPVLITFMCVDCFSSVPTIKEMETLIDKIKQRQKEWTIKKETYVSFLSMTGEGVSPLKPPQEREGVSPLKPQQEMEDTTPPTPTPQILDGEEKNPFTLHI